MVVGGASRGLRRQAALGLSVERHTQVGLWRRPRPTPSPAPSTQSTPPTASLPFSRRSATSVRVNTDQLCVGSTCVTEPQLQALLSQPAAAAIANPSPSETPTVDESATSTDPTVHAFATSTDPIVHESATSAEAANDSAVSASQPEQEPGRIARRNHRRTRQRQSRPCRSRSALAFKSGRQAWAVPDQRWRGCAPTLV